MVIAIFRARVREDRAEEYFRRAQEMADIARAMPGFVSFKSYAAPDGERVSIHEWASAEALIETDDASFLDRGVLDSLGFVKLIVYLEDTFGIAIDRKHLSRDNFDSLAKIVTYTVEHRGFRGIA